MSRIRSVVILALVVPLVARGAEPAPTTAGQSEETAHKLPEFSWDTVPVGPAEKDGHVYTRRYEHLDVQVDIREREAVLSWR